MTSKRSLQVYLPLLLATAWFGCSDTSELAAFKNPPNVVLIMTDDQGWGDLSLNGNTYVETPNIDQLAGEGSRFDRFYVSPVCAPTRASLLTGKYHLRTGTTWVTHRKEVMRSSETTIAEILKSHGYHTGIFGKWHNGEQYPNDPHGQGFEEFYGFASGHWNNYFDTPLLHNDEEVTSDGWIIDDLTNIAIEFIEKHKSKPFFTYIPYNTPHGPFQVPDKYFEKYKAKGLDDKNACVYAMCENIDDNVGRLLNYLNDTGLRENTIVIYMTDNGPNGGDRYNGDMRGSKGHVYEGGVRVPSIWSYPGKILENHVVHQDGAHIDILPTLLSLAGIEEDLGGIDGVDLSSFLLKNEKAKPFNRMIYSFQLNGQKKNYPIAARDTQYSYVISPSQNHELYDLLADPKQKMNIITDKPELAKKMRETLLAQFEYVTAVNPFTPPPIPVAYTTDKPVHLPAHEAQLEGDVTFRGTMGWANDYTVNWSEEDRMTWVIDVKVSQYYKVEIQYSASQENEIELVITNQNVQMTLPSGTAEVIPSPDRVPRKEVFEKKWKAVMSNEIQLSPDINDITLIGKTIRAELEIKGIKLIPV